MLHVKHFGTIDVQGNRTFAARGTVQSRDLARTKDRDRVHAGVWLPSRTNHHCDTPRAGRDFLQLHPMRAGERFDGGTGLGFAAAHRDEDALVLIST
jgi:hypothetical protein